MFQSINDSTNYRIRCTECIFIFLKDCTLCKTACYPPPTPSAVGQLSIITLSD